MRSLRYPRSRLLSIPHIFEGLRRLTILIVLGDHHASELMLNPYPYGVCDRFMIVCP
jgi:hypothetical protein